MKTSTILFLISLTVVIFAFLFVWRAGQLDRYTALMYAAGFQIGLTVKTNKRN